MDAEQRTRWRARLKATHPWLCEVCKTALANQSRFDQMEAEGLTLYRHAECGHVLSWRAGGVDWLEPYLADPMQESLKPMPVGRMFRLPPLPPQDGMQPKRTQRQPG